ncbi:MAG: DNA-3-methyladenine glycosylase [Bacteroidales bacterium]|jgi:DNA-3-methyladenine glycosylase|nr:DNA-3-methyladenine glycosylase [Bacteroidales bacterium]
MLDLEYYRQPDVFFLAEALIGKQLFTYIDGQIAGGIITATEALQGVGEETAHLQGGIIYVSKCEGDHHHLHIVTNEADIPDVILIRALKATHGEELMLKRLGKTRMDPQLTNEPEKVAKALGIAQQHDGMALDGTVIWAV